MRSSTTYFALRKILHTDGQKPMAAQQCWLCCRDSFFTWRLSPRVTFQQNTEQQRVPLNSYHMVTKHTVEYWKSIMGWIEDVLVKIHRWHLIIQFKELRGKKESPTVNRFRENVLLHTYWHFNTIVLPSLLKEDHTQKGQVQKSL